MVIIMETTNYRPEDESQTEDKHHILLTSLGTAARQTKYQLNQQLATAELAPLALVQLLDNSLKPNRVIVTVTKGAKTAKERDSGKLILGIFKKGIKEVLGFEPEVVDIPDGSDEDEIRQLLENVAKSIPESAELTLDVTHGLRHFPFIFYALALYLQSLRNVRIRGAYYGMMEGSQHTKPIVDLQPLLELPKWFYAVQMFKDRGTALPIAELVAPLRDRLVQQTTELFRANKETEAHQWSKNRNRAKASVESLEKHAFAYESALPVELGKASNELIERIQKLTEIDKVSLPLFTEELTQNIAEAAKKLALSPEVSKRHWKEDIALDITELERQAQMIDQYLERGQLSLAIGLMREWVVSWSILQSEETEGWLKREARKRSERRLGALAEFAKSSHVITPEQQAFGTFWDQLTDKLRNALHHHGMRPEALEEPPDILEKSVKSFWNQLKAGKIALPQLGGGSGKLLLSPQGTRPGVLFSALKATKPDSCLVICSNESASSIPEAAECAAFNGTLEQIKLKDPHGGFDEISKAAKCAHEYILNADTVLANVTGGTTLMGLIVQQLVEKSQYLDRHVRRFALIDRRTPAEQDSHPFVEGEHHWIDG